MGVVMVVVGWGKGGKGACDSIVSCRLYNTTLSLYEVFYREVLFRYMSQPNHEYNPSRLLLLYGAPNSNISSRAYI